MNQSSRLLFSIPETEPRQNVDEIRKQLLIYRKIPQEQFPQVVFGEVFVDILSGTEVPEVGQDDALAIIACAREHCQCTLRKPGDEMLA